MVVFFVQAVTLMLTTQGSRKKLLTSEGRIAINVRKFYSSRPDFISASLIRRWWYR